MTVTRLIRATPVVVHSDTGPHSTLPECQRAEGTMDNMSFVRRGSRGNNGNNGNTTTQPGSPTSMASFNDLPLNPRERNMDEAVVLPPLDNGHDECGGLNRHSDGVSDLQDVPVASLSSDYSSSDDQTKSNTGDRSIPVHHDDVGSSLPSAFALPRMKRNKLLETTKYLGRPRIRCVVLAVAIVLFVCVVAWLSPRRSTSSTPTVDQIAKFLTQHGISSLDDVDLDDGTLPHVLAMEWMDVPLPQNPSNDDLIHSEDYQQYVTRYVLSLLYFSLSGTHWWHELGFLSTQHVCEWHELVLSEKGDTSSTLGVVCNDQNHLVELNLRKNNIKGEIPTEIGLLSLQHLDWGQNLLDGILPSTMCSLSQLTSLDIGENQLRGSLPSCMGQWTALEQLDVHDNDLTGSLPTALGTLTQLKRLFLSANIITGDPVSLWNNLTQLELLLADNNEFTAEINSDFLRHLRKLTWLDLSSNDFTVEGRTSTTSMIPAHLFQTTHLQVLDLSKNRLVGQLPWGLDRNADLKYLSLYDNILHGGLDHLTSLVGLRHLDVSRNALTGTLPAKLADLTHLRLLFLGENHFTSAQMMDLTPIDHLHDLSMRKSNITGVFNPRTLPSSLVYLDMGSNLLTGTLTDTIGNFLHLEFLMLNDNAQLHGSLPTTIATLTNLRAIFLDGTGINGNVAAICTLPKFQKSNGHEIAFADCSEPYDTDGPAPFVCECCECCEHFNDTQTHGCSIPFQQNLRHAWSIDFQTLHADVTNETIFLNREYIPPFRTAGN